MTAQLDKLKETIRLGDRAKSRSAGRVESETGCEDAHSCSFVARAKYKPPEPSRNLH